jgi:hypothetical protein
VLDEGAGAPDGADGERRDVLRRIAVLRDERLRDGVGALEALCRYVPLDPVDEARSHTPTRAA